MILKTIIQEHHEKSNPTRRLFDPCGRGAPLPHGVNHPRIYGYQGTRF